MWLTGVKPVGARVYRGHGQTKSEEPHARPQQANLYALKQKLNWALEQNRKLKKENAQLRRDLERERLLGPVRRALDAKMIRG